MNPNISQHVFRNSMPSEEFPHKNIVLIDTHNFTTTALEALGNGAREIIPLTSLNGGISNRIDVIAGDNEAPYDNHPEDMSKTVVDGNIIGIDSWNGSSAVHEIRALDGWEHVYLCSLTNIPILARYLKGVEGVSFVLSGSNGNTPPEDVLTMQCLYHGLTIMDEFLEPVLKNYNMFYESYVESIYDSIYETENSSGPFGTPEGHANEIASDVGRWDIIPVMQENGSFSRLRDIY